MKIKSWLTAGGIFSVLMTLTWLAGYDFDDRNIGIASWIGMCCLFSVIIGSMNE